MKGCHMHFLNVIQKKVLCSAEKSSVIWAEPHGKSSAEQFGRTERSVGHYFRICAINVDTYWLSVMTAAPTSETIMRYWLSASAIIKTSEVWPEMVFSF